LSGSQTGVLIPESQWEKLGMFQARELERATQVRHVTRAGNRQVSGSNDSEKNDNIREMDGSSMDWK